MTIRDTASSETTNGSPSVAPVAPGRPTGIGPAAIVAGIGVVLVAIFVVIALVSGGGGAKPHAALTGPVAGTTLRAQPGKALLAPLEQGGEPPGNVVSAIALPVGSVRVSAHNSGAGLGQYDQRATFSVHATQAAVYDFFHTEMRRAGWSISDAGPTGGANNLEVLGKMAGSDGWYWEMGATVSPTTFATTPAGPGTGPSTTRFVVRLYQVSDES